MQRAVAFAVLCWVALAGVSCPRTWHFAILSLDSELRPEFCISTRESCRGDPVGLSTFAVQEVVEQTIEGETFRDFLVVWGIQARVDAPLGRFTYGATPEGWTEDHAAEPLGFGKTYSVGPYWFVLEPGEPPSWSVMPRQILPKAK